MLIQNSQKQKVILLDFCETIVKFQSADRFVEYVSKVKNSNLIRLLILFYRIVRKIGIVNVLEKYLYNSSINKRLILLRLIGLSQNEIDSLALTYYRDIIKPSLIEDSILALNKFVKKGYRIIIVSGGYDVYLKYFAKDFDISDIVCTKIKFKYGRCLGLFSGLDCINENKIKLLNKFLKDNNIVINKELSYAMTDSESDLPLLQSVDNRIIVHRVGRNEWFKKYDYNKIIYW